MGDIKQAYELVIQACQDPFVGYSQAKRTTIRLGGSTRTYCDCSSLMSWALTFAGFYSNNPWFSTHNQRQQLQKIGFHEEPIDGEWKKGDILWRAGHTEMVYNYERVTMGAHTDSYVFAKQVSINEFASRPREWTSCWRYKNGVEEDKEKLNVSIYVICAIVGNWSRESNVNPGVYEGLNPKNPGFGLGQWSFERRRNLENWLDSHGYSRDSGEGQCLFFYEENDWQKATSKPLKFDSLYDFLTTDNKDIPALTETFMYAWERPGVPGLADRIAFAQKAYTYILEHSDDDVQWIVGNRYLSEAEQLNNAVAVYQALSIGENEDGGEGYSNLLRFGIARELYRRRYIWR